MAKKIWSADEGRIWMSGQDTADFNFTGIHGSGFTAQVTDIRITGGGRDVDGIRAFGSGANFYVYTKGQEMYEATITMVKKDAAMDQLIMGGSYTTDMPQSFIGDKLRNPVDVVYEWIDRLDVSGAHLRITMQDAYATSHEVSQGVDGHIEETISFKCAPSKFKVEYTDARVGSPLS